MRITRRARALEMVTEAYELEAGVSQGVLRRNPADGQWMVRDTPLDLLLERFAGQEVALIVAPLEDDKPMPTKTCHTCGEEYVGAECPHCREVRTRLRGDRL